MFKAPDAAAYIRPRKCAAIGAAWHTFDGERSAVTAPSICFVKDVKDREVAHLQRVGRKVAICSFGVSDAPREPLLERCPLQVVGP